MIKVSVIIPTFNRIDYLGELLASLAKQSYPTELYEVIVVDDGSTDGTRDIATATFPFTLRYFWQTNQGDAAARNLGVQHSQADILVFLDDDILVESNYLPALLKAHEGFRKRIVVGTEHLWLNDTNPLDLNSSILEIPPGNEDNLVAIPFADICSNNMSVRREAYFEIGMMQTLDFPGSSIWCDVDFAYRAYQKNFEFLQSTLAICYHRDYVAQNLENSKKRMQKVAYRAVVLFQKYPDLLPHLPMFDDKTPIAWGKDKPALITRKLARHIASSYLALWGMEWLVDNLKKYYPSSGLLSPLYRWIVGGYIFQGFREGLRDFGLPQKQNEGV